MTNRFDRHLHLYEAVCSGPLLAVIPAVGSLFGAGTSTLSAIGTAAGLAGTVISAVGAIEQGNAAKRAANYEAAQMEQRANEALAIGQKKAFQAQEQKDRALSALNARSAASGGDTSDPGIETLGAGIENRGETQALMEFYKGESASDNYKDAANAARYRGSQAKAGSYFKAAGTVFDGFSSLASKYGPRSAAVRYG